MTTGGQIVVGSAWDTEMVGMTGRDNLRDIIGYVREHAEKFANDYLAANPRN